LCYALVASACSVCGRPAAALVSGGLRADERLICGQCLAVMDDARDARLATIGPDELDEAAAVTAEDAYLAALADEQEWHIRADGTLSRG